jgi:hypothetical protein
MVNKTFLPPFIAPENNQTTENKRIFDLARLSLLTLRTAAWES